MRWPADPSSVFHLASPATNGTIILPTRQVLMNAPSLRRRPCHLTSDGLGPVSGVCGVFQVVKTAQTRGRTERTLLYTVISALRRRALAGRRNAAERRNPSLSHELFATPEFITLASADAFPVVGGRCTGRAHRCKAKQGRRGKTALRCEFLLPQ
jgi:hypothetical protein